MNNEPPAGVHCWLVDPLDRCECIGGPMDGDELSLGEYQLARVFRHIDTGVLATFATPIAVGGEWRWLGYYFRNSFGARDRCHWRQI